MNTKKLIEKLNDYLRELVVNNEQYEMFVEIKSFLEQQYQHEQNILDYGTDEPDEKQPQPDNELINVCCRAKIKIEYVDCGEGQGYPREICAKCRKEIIEVPIRPDDELVEKIIDIAWHWKHGMGLDYAKAEIRKLLKGEK